LSGRAAGEEAKAAAHEQAVLATGGRFAPTVLGMAKMLEQGVRPAPRGIVSWCQGIWGQGCRGLARVLE
jgi:hypothetical protein